MRRADLATMGAEWLSARPGAVLDVIDTHTAGNPTRIIVGGIPLPEEIHDVAGARAWLRESAGWVRSRLVHEPRGGGLTCAVLPLPSTGPDHDLGAVILEPGSYPPMCGHCMIGLAVAVDEFGLVPGSVAAGGRRDITIRTPAGLVRAGIRRGQGVAGTVELTNVASSLTHSWTQVLGERRVRVDLSYGGDYYATVDAAELGLPLQRRSALDIVTYARELAATLAESPPRDPRTGELLDVYQVMFYERLDALSCRVVVVAPPGEIDRSPCGTGSSALLALLLSRGELGAGDTLTTRSIIDSRFTVRASDVDQTGDHPTVTPVLTGSAHVTGFSRIVADPLDVLADGFELI
ncbi:proline racemase family protein [Amycolatopsis sp. K13G38]|uniref:Proline racemase family protein n=1 Tax=Amycolatopsis acididurans TaxID=2724524 RepID=A0ABX1JH20_9PSEU|nr:proline racemase family protein [Amycolatopsis acididurans]NKQ57715.1 proline racemase family protein [Amycolatopsis acididurans]